LLTDRETLQPEFPSASRKCCEKSCVLQGDWNAQKNRPFNLNDKFQEECGMIQATALRRGMLIKKDGELFSVFSAIHKTPGNLRGFVQARLRNLRNGAMGEFRFRSVDMVEKVSLDEHEMEYLYKDANDYYFMNTETYEQTHLNEEVLGDSVLYLIPNIKIKVEFYEGNPIGIDLPASVEMVVVETEPGLKSATASNVNKPAKMETGLIVQVPPFIDIGEKIRVDTNEGKYLERVR
jgi:elongation factor P